MTGTATDTNTHDAVLAIVAHDLRSPLSTIIMAADLIDSRANDDKTRHYADIIIKAAQQADALIKDLIEATQLESGDLRLHTSPEPLDCMLASTAELYEPQAEQAGLLLACDTSGVQHIDVLADRDRFVQVLNNLLTNAIKFTPRGGSILLNAAREGDYAVVSISDTGMGISADELPHIFERFWQADRHHRAGTGLGLAIAKGLAEAHGGEIRVSSRIGYGSTFSVTIPIVAD